MVLCFFFKDNGSLFNSYLLPSTWEYYSQVAEDRQQGRDTTFSPCFLLATILGRSQVSQAFVYTLKLVLG